MIYEKRKQRTNYRVKTRNKSGLPRLVVYRSNNNLYGQIILDSEHIVLTSISTNQLEFSNNDKSYNVGGARTAGIELGKRANDLNIKKVCIDCNGYLYHGRVKAFIDAFIKQIG